jgi:antitoxin component YwqK of YwqJK toxin-antitoxin module
MKKLLTLIIMLCVSAMAYAQYSHVVVGPNGNKTEEGLYNADPGILPSDSKDIIANKMAAVHKIGTWKYWFDNGQMSAEEHYDNSGLAIGEWKSWDSNGQLVSDWNRTSGAVTFYHPNGKKAEEGTIDINSNRTGNWTGWYDSGNINYTGSYNAAGQKIGSWKFYDQAGNVYETETYVNGVKTN